MDFKKSGAVSGKLAARAILGKRGLPLVRRAMRQERFWAENARISQRWGNFWLGGRDVAAAGMKFAKIGAKIAKVG